MYEHRSIALAGVIAAGLLAGSSVGAMAQTDEAVSASPTRQPCPNPYGGGACLGPLEPGTYEPSVFRTPFSYTVPEGWSNYEDEPGNSSWSHPEGRSMGWMPGPVTTSASPWVSTSRAGIASRNQKPGSDIPLRP